MKICIIIPCKNEEENIITIFNKINKVLENNFEIIFIDDGSNDNSWKNIYDLSLKNKNISGIKLQKSFGKDNAIFCALENIDLLKYKGVLFMDCDLQHPVNIAKQMIDEFNKNQNQFIYAHRRKFKTSIFRLFFSFLFHFISKKIFRLNFKDINTDFFIISSSLAQRFLFYKEINISLRSIILDLNIKNQKRINFNAPIRIYGKSNFSFSKLSNLALHTITYNTYIPTKFIIFFGLILIICFLFLLIFMIASQYIFGVIFYNLISYFIIYNSILLSVIIFLIGIISLYIGNIQQEILSRPRYLIEDKI